MRRKIVAGNWKMHGSNAQNRDLLSALRAGSVSLGCEVLVCPPYPYLAQVADALEGTAIVCGAQNLSQHLEGAFTGEVSAAMLADLGCRYVIIGHSERRTLFGESDAVLVAKFVAARQAGLCPIFCLGESLVQRQAGKTLEVVFEQLNSLLQVVGVEGLVDAVLAYEPVWAIGTGLSATPEEAQEVHAALRGMLSALDVDVAAALRILYGGSVKAGNAQELFVQPDIDGGLIGGASLVAQDFLAICRAAN